MELFLFLGPEEFRKYEEMTGIVAKHFSSRGNEAESSEPRLKVQSYHAASVNIDELRNLLLTPPLFGDIPPVLLSDIDLLSLKDQKRLAELCAQCRKQNQGMFFLFSKEIKISAVLGKVFPKSEQKIFWDLSEAEKKRKIHSLLQKNGAKIEESAIELLMGRVSTDLLTIERTLDTVLLYLGHGKSSADAKNKDAKDSKSSEELFISEDLLSTIFTQHRSASVYELFHHIVERNWAQSLETAESLLLEGNNKAVSLLTQLLYQWDKLLQVKERISANDSFDDACQAEYIRVKALKRDMQRGVQNYQLGELRQIQKLNQDYNLSLKWSSGELQDLQFKHYLYEVLHIGR